MTTARDRDGALGHGRSDRLRLGTGRAAAALGLAALVAACQATMPPASPALPASSGASFAGPSAGSPAATGTPSAGASAKASPTSPGASPSGSAPGAGATSAPRPTLSARPSSTPAAGPSPTPVPTARPTVAPSLRPSPTPAGTGSSPISHVVVVWMENREASAVTASTMPYLYGLSQTYGRADAFYAVTHPSLPNYLAFWSGSTQGVTDDAIHDLPGASLSNQLTAAGRSWRIYAQDYPAGGCSSGGAYTGGVDGPGVAGTYARKHDPAMSFTYVSGSSQCANIQPLARFDPGVNLAFVVPNLCNDMHDCSAAQGDAFLRAFLPEVLSAPEWPHTLLVVSFDEGATSVNGGGRVFTMVARQGLSGVRSSTFHDHYGLLRTIEDTFGLPCLNSSCGATPLDEFLP